MNRERKEDRLYDLLAARATEGLDPRAERELDGLIDEFPEVDPDSLDLAAAASDLAVARIVGRASDDADLPPDCRRRIRERLQADASYRTARESTPRGAAGYGWWAAAAMFLLALLSWWPRVAERAPTVDPTPEARYAALVAEADDLLRVAWAPPEIEAYADVRGEVVWSGARQEGFLRLRGMPANDPAVSQYQLWIVDPDRDAEPVDGGVFDIASGDEALVPIDPKLAVVAPAAFAITREKPGGVVVSEGPLLVVASVSAGGGAG